MIPPAGAHCRAALALEGDQEQADDKGQSRMGEVDVSQLVGGLTSGQTYRERASDGDI